VRQEKGAHVKSSAPSIHATDRAVIGNVDCYFNCPVPRLHFHCCLVLSACRVSLGALLILPAEVVFLGSASCQKIAVSEAAIALRANLQFLDSRGHLCTGMLHLACWLILLRCLLVSARRAL
jgi:hypothetical protein